MPTKTKTSKSAGRREMKVSTETKIMAAVSSMFDFTTSNTKKQLVEANRLNLIAGIELNENQIAALSNIIETSIRDAFVKSSGEVVGIINALEL